MVLRIVFNHAIRPSIVSKIPRDTANRGAQDAHVRADDAIFSLLEPIGKHRLDFVQPSKGKRSKRKRSDGGSEIRGDSPQMKDMTMSGLRQLSNVPPEPEVASFLTIGFNSTERALEAAAHNRTARSFSSIPAILSENELPQMVAIFVDRTDHTDALNAHLPLLVSTASHGLPLETKIRLVGLPRGATGRLSAALRIPRASMIGLYSDAPNSAALVDLVRKHVSAIEVPWLKGLREGIYIPAEIIMRQIVASKKSEKRSRSVKASPIRQLQVGN